MLVRLGEAREEVPPVGDQRGDAPHEAAAFQVAGGEPSPAAVVLELVDRLRGQAGRARSQGHGPWAQARWQGSLASLAQTPRLGPDQPHR
jgi:hypothetical protein